MTQSETVDPAPPVKPRLRGVLHQWASVAAAGAVAALVAMAPSGRSALAAGVFGLSLVTLFAVSATYHRVHWSARWRAVMRRLDHASIFVLIAGTYTPIAALGLPVRVGDPLLRLVWAAALAGVAQSVLWIRAPKAVAAALALAMGWTIVPYLPEVRRALPAAVFALVAAGGVVYSLGAVAYATKRPDPRPRVCGYHEVFHACTLVGAALHFAAVVLLTRGAPVGLRA